jgi:SPP1 gp7 family putative phage head morphogenesis protein
VSPAELIKTELEFFNLKYPFISNYKIWHKELLNKVNEMLDKGKPLRSVKKYIRDALKDYYNTYIKSELRDLNLKQAQKILDKENIDIYDIETPIFNMTLAEMIASRVNTHFKSIITNIEDDRLNNINKIKSTNLNTLTSLTYNYLKASRQDKIYPKLENKNNIKGWLYSAILDRRTSKMCLTLNGRFFKREDYKTRGDLPYIPNKSTHYNCRSILITIYSDKDLQTYKVDSLNDFIKNDPEEAKKALGKTRYELIKEGKITVNELIDFKRATFYNLDIIFKRIKEG